MRKVLLILFLILVATNPIFAATKYVKKEISTYAKDNFIIKSTLEYPKIKNKKEYSTVVLLHSLGYNSEWWGELPKLLLENGYAVLKIDLRGHGNSIYNSKLVRTSWKNMNNNGFSKYPNDVNLVLNTVMTENPKRVFFNKWAIVGADIGVNTGILAGDTFSSKPQIIIMLSPVIETKGLYIPVKIANYDSTDFLSISSVGDKNSQEAEEYLKKFIQTNFITYTSSAKSSGMLMLKSDENINLLLKKWLESYL